jgi:serine/threonine protein kinase
MKFHVTDFDEFVNALAETKLPSSAQHPTGRRSTCRKLFLSRGTENSCYESGVCKRVRPGVTRTELSFVKKYFVGALLRERCVCYGRNRTVDIRDGIFQTFRELMILKDLKGRCPYIVELEEVELEASTFSVQFRYGGSPVMKYDDAFGGYAAFVLDLLNVSVFRLKPRGHPNVLVPEDCLTCLVQVLNGLSFLRECGIVHKDIKPENILISHPLCRWRRADDKFITCHSEWSHEYPIHITICDFNTAERVDGGRIYDAQGTMLFSPPEVFGFIDPENGVDGYARDAWSAGMLAYCMLAGLHPLNNDVPPLEYQLNLLGMRDRNERILLPSGICDSTPQLKNIVEGLLDLNPVSRLTAPDALEYLKVA